MNNNAQYTHDNTDRQNEPDMNQRGFTLVEVLAAFVILTISLVSIYQAFSTGAMGIDRATDHALLALEAESKMSEIDTIFATTSDRSSRNLGGSRDWVVTAKPVDNMFSSPPNSAKGQLFLVELVGKTKSGQKVEFLTYKYWTNY